MKLNDLVTQQIYKYICKITDTKFNGQVHKLVYKLVADIALSTFNYLLTQANTQKNNQSTMVAALTVNMFILSRMSVVNRNMSDKKK